MNYYSYSRQTTPEPTVQWLTSTWTCRWIIDNAIIEVILGALCKAFYVLGHESVFCWVLYKHDCV